MRDPLASLPERRERYRINLQGQVWVSTAANERFVGQVTDLSASGLSFITGVSIAPTTQLTIYVKLEPAASQPLMGEAEVVHTAVCTDKSFHVRCKLSFPLQ